MNFFITATDTDVGKTYVGARLADIFARKGDCVGYFKPFQSGVEQGVKSDVEIVARYNPDIIIKNSYITKTPATPALSAEIDGIKISLEQVLKDYHTLQAQCDKVITEGSGGLFVPVGANLLMSDVILALNLPVIIVARPDLGTINHTLLTIEAAKNLGIKVLAVVISKCPCLSGDPAITNAKRYIEKFSGVHVFELFEEGSEFAPELISVLES